MSAFLMATAILFIIIDVWMGFRRGFFPAILRLAFVAFCAVFAYIFSSSVSHYLLEIQIADGQSLQALYEGYLQSMPELAAALALSDPIEQIVFHLPEVLVSEISFVLLFFVARLVTLPVFFLVSRILFGKPQKRSKKTKVAKKKSTEDGGTAEAAETQEKKRRSLAGTFRSGGMVIGLLQGVLCFAILLVPIFGVVEFGEHFDAAFAGSDQEALITVSEDIRNGIVDPVNESSVGIMADTVGLRDVCSKVFHQLSNTTIVLSTGERTIDYFEYVESMFPAISALLKLADVDPEHMTDTDYENLCVVLETAQSHEDIVVAVKDSVSGVVAEFVDDSFRSSADVVVTTFTDKIMSEDNQMDAEKLKAEVASVQDTLKVLQTATSESADSAFEVVSADALVDGIIETEILYDTLIEVVNDPEKREILRADFLSTDEQKALMKTEIENYRSLSMETRSLEELERIVEITDALAIVLDVDISELPSV